LALDWIQTAVDRDRGTYNGTEWLHVKILEAKLRTAANSVASRGQSVLGLDFGDAPRPTSPQQRVADQFRIGKTLGDIRSALEYQLHERMGLVPPPDPIMADLLFDLGNLLALDNLPDQAAGVYELSLEYDPSRAEQLVRRHQYLKELGLHQFDPEPLRAGLIAAAAAGGGLLVVALAFLIYRYRSAPRVV
jgi:hypothetical protein